MFYLYVLFKRYFPDVQYTCILYTFLRICKNDYKRDVTAKIKFDERWKSKIIVETFENKTLIPHVKKRFMDYHEDGGGRKFGVATNARRTNVHKPIRKLGICSNG